MNVPIDNYRGFDIIFNTDDERFSYSIDLGSYFEKQTYSACKTSIDNYMKDNASFEPFYVREKSSGKLIRIIGLRKDNRFIYEGYNLKKEQLSEYNEKEYIEVDESHDAIYANIATLEADIDSIRKKITEHQEKITGKTLKELKQNLRK